MIDGLILAVPMFTVAFGILDLTPREANVGVGMFLSSAFQFIYEFGFVAAMGRTPGKAAVGLRIVAERTHERAGAREGALRGLVFAVHPFIQALALIDYLFVFAGNEKQTIHDRIASTLVVDDRH